MILTRLTLDTTRRRTRSYLGNPQQLHAAVMCAAAPSDDAVGGISSDAPGQGRVLWRVDLTPSSAHLYVLSPGRPRFADLAAEAGAGGGDVRSLPYEPLLERLTKGQVWSFRLTANPARAVSQGPGVRGKRSGHVTVEQQRQWLLSRAESRGFSLPRVAAGDDGSEETPSLLVVRRARPVFSRRHKDGPGRDRVTINRTVFEGLLRVEDADTFRHTLVSGLGPSKAYGCGLMTLARPRV